MPIEIRIPSHSVLNPSDTAAVVGGNVLTSQRVTDVVYITYIHTYKIYIFTFKHAYLHTTYIHTYKYFYILYVCIYSSIVSRFTCMYVCMCVCMYVCMCVYMYVQVLRAFKACAASQGCMNNLTFGDSTMV